MIDTLEFIHKFQATDLEQAEHANGVPSYFAVHAGEEEYFATNIELLNDLSESSPNVTFVVARGATGKTALSQALSRSLRAPLWNTALDRTLSAYSLHLHLTRYLHVVEPLIKIRELEFPLVIIDGVDEAQARVSAESWQDFKNSLMEFADQGVHFIILGRELAIFDIASKFERVDRGGFIYELKAFSQEQSQIFLDARYRILSGTSETSLHSSYYSQCKETIFSAVKSQLESSNSFDDETVNQFLGYAPVLEAVAIRLAASSNIASLNRELEKVRGLSEQMLVSVVETILDRETEKVPAAFENYATTNVPVFGPEEQIGLIFFRMGFGNEPAIPSCIPASEEAGYRDFREKQIEDHPFIISGKTPSWASKVFEGYALFHYSEKISYRRDLVMMAMENPLLFSFAAIADDYPIADEWFISALHSSLVAFHVDAKKVLEGETFYEKPIAQVLLAADGNYQYCVFTPRIKHYGEITDIEFQEDMRIDFLQEDDNALNFYGPLEQVIINAPNILLHLKPLNRVPYIGPQLIVSAGTVVVDAHEARLRRKFKSTSGVSRISANRIDVSLPRIPDFKEGEFINPKVLLNSSSASELLYPWNLFVENKESLQHETPVRILPEVIDRFYRIVSELKRLRAQSKKNSGTDRAGWCARVGVDRASSVAHDILSLLKHEGVIKEENGKVFYIDDPDSRPLFSTIYDVPPNSSREYSDLEATHRHNWTPVLDGLIKVQSDNGSI